MKIVLFLISFLVAIPLLSLPQYQLLTGNRCGNCHVNHQGGGQRNELGYYAMADVSILKPDFIMKNLPESNSPFSNTMVGLDLRAQMARGVADDAERRVFPMQFAAYASHKTTDWLTLEGTFSFYNKNRRYPGQQMFFGSALIQPNLDFPQLRVGYFQPSIGVRFDDHTNFARLIPNNRVFTTPIIAPNYAELGAEMTYDLVNYKAKGFVTLTGGAFSTRSLNDVSMFSENGQFKPIVGTDDISYIGRIQFSENHLLTDITNSTLGASYFTNAGVTFTNVFGGVGVSDAFSIMAEYSMKEANSFFSIQSTSISAMYQATEGVFFEIRAEESSGTVQQGGEKVTNTNKQLVLSSQLFLFPGIVLRPEYRILDTEQQPRLLEQYTSSRFFVQLYAFF